MSVSKSDLLRIREAFKGVDRKKLAEELHLKKRNIIDQYATGLKRTSPRRAKEIEKASGGMVPAKVLRPDIFGDD